MKIDRIVAIGAFGSAAFFYLIYMALWARITNIYIITQATAGWGLTGAVLGLVTSGVGVLLMFVEGLYKNAFIKLGLGALVCISFWFTGGGVGLLASFVSAGANDGLINGCLTMGVIASLCICVGFIASVFAKTTGLKTPAIPGMAAYAVVAVFALVGLGLSAKTRSDLGTGINFPEAFALAGDTLLIIFSSLGAVALIANLWQPEGTVGQFLRDTVWGFCFFGLWLVGAYCGLTSIFVTTVISRVQAEFAMHVIAALAASVAISLSAALGHEEKDG